MTTETPATKTAVDETPLLFEVRRPSGPRAVIYRRFFDPRGLDFGLSIRCDGRLFASGMDSWSGGVMPPYEIHVSRKSCGDVAPITATSAGVGECVDETGKPAVPVGDDGYGDGVRRIIHDASAAIRDRVREFAAKGRADQFDIADVNDLVEEHGLRIAADVLESVKTEFNDMKSRLAESRQDRAKQSNLRHQAERDLATLREAANLLPFMWLERGGGTIGSIGPVPWRFSVKNDVVDSSPYRTAWHARVVDAMLAGAAYLKQGTPDAAHNAPPEGTIVEPAVSSAVSPAAPPPTPSPADASAIMHEALNLIYGACVSAPAHDASARWAASVAAAALRKYRATTCGESPK